MSLSFYDCIRKKKQLNYTQKESMADIFCFRGHEVLRCRFIFALDKLTRSGTSKALELYKEPFEDIVFNNNKCTYKTDTADADTKPYPKATLLESIRILVIREAEEANRKKI